MTCTHSLNPTLEIELNIMFTYLIYIDYQVIIRVIVVQLAILVIIHGGD